MDIPNRGMCAACTARRANFERMIEGYHAAAKRRVLQRTMRLFEEAEADHALAHFERTPDRIH